ncbi:MAG: iron chelate uptake ABC transporter family permease subunit [Planctomycetota bacterium]|nr:iron chelate uptake ABC transporter family permease subunit [Planctomycetota bacterium]
MSELVVWLVDWAPVMVGGAVAGASTGMLGVYIIGMRIPFLGVCVSHAALAGAVFGALFGLTGPVLLIPALAGAIVTALLLGLLEPETTRININVLMGLLFTLSMGLAFLGIGLFDRFDRSDNDVRNLLWGSLIFCRWNHVKLMSAVAAVQIAFVVLFYKEMRAIMFSRLHAAAAGVHVTLIWTIFLILTATVLTVNFQTIGGLMIYSLMANPAAAAFLLVKGHGRALATAMLLGAASGLGGFIIAAIADLPTGAMIVIVSSVFVGIAAIVSRRRRRGVAN